MGARRSGRTDASIDAVAFAPRLMFLTVHGAREHAGGDRGRRAARARWGRTKVRDDPVFVLGHPRTGTTHLHNILAKDETRFGAATTFDVGFPSGFLSSGFMKPVPGEDDGSDETDG